MISVDSLLYDIDFKLNKLSSNEHQQIPLEDKILAINEAQILLIKQKMDSNNVLSGGFDAFKKRYEDLQKLVESASDHPLDLKLQDKKLNRWVAKLDNIKPAYMFYVDSYIIAEKGECKDRVIWVNQDLAKHGDIQYLLTSTHYKPSFEYQETFNIISSDEISVFTDGSFIPKKLFISYIRYPQYIDKEGYIKLDGSDSINQDCELKNYLKDELIDIAVQRLAMYTENVAATQNAQARINNNE